MSGIKIIPGSRVSAVVANLTTVHHPTCPDHQEVPVCSCGANVACRSCGYGRGQAPCECTPPIETAAYDPKPYTPDPADVRQGGER